MKHCLRLLLRALPQNSNLCVLPPEPLFAFRTANLILSNTIRQLFGSNISSELERTKIFRFLRTMVLSVSLFCFLVDLKITKNNRSLIGGITHLEPEEGWCWWELMLTGGLCWILMGGATHRLITNHPSITGEEGLGWRGGGGGGGAKQALVRLSWPVNQAGLDYQDYHIWTPLFHPSPPPGWLL